MSVDRYYSSLLWKRGPVLAENNFPSDEDFSIASDISAQDELAESVKRYLRTKVDTEKNQKLYICDLCKSETTGMQPFIQHVRGNAHKKKERAKRMSSGASFSGQFQGAVRDPLQNGATAAVVRQSDQNVAVGGEPTVKPRNQSNPVEQFASASPLHDVENQSPRGSQDKSLTELMRDMFPDNDSGYDLSNFSVRSHSSTESERNYGRCTTCGTEFYDASDVERHLKSDEHRESLKNAVTDLRKPNVNGVLVCNICGRAATNRTIVPEFKDVKGFNAHLASDDHILNVRREGGTRVMIKCITCNLSIREKGYYVHLQSSEHNLNINIAIQLTPIVDDGRLRGQKGVVTDGNPSLSPHAARSAGTPSAANAERNANIAGGASKVPDSTGGEESSKALSTVAGSSASNSGYRNYNRCDICNVNFTNVNMANDHYKGKKHQKKALSLDGSDTSSSSTRDSLTTSVDSEMSIRVIKKCVIPDFDSSEEREAYYETKQIVRSTPRYYQHDLFRRVMLDDYSYYCFLPTGNAIASFPHIEFCTVGWWITVLTFSQKMAEYICQAVFLVKLNIFPFWFSYFEDPYR